nr:hypothetical protein [uncultured Marinifilum sp.]
MNVDTTVSIFLTELKDYNFEICYLSDCLTENNKNKLFQWIKKSYEPEVLYGRTSFDNIYTFDKESWDSGCSPQKNKPLILIEYVIETKNILGFAYKSGGLAIQNKFILININKSNEELILDRSSEKLTDLVFELTQSN